ncbi:uncharacterized protein LOC142239306 [Haematobia irritans]|uniref:uncharacterized protein LOC142239306 n=1 Tax=Haematobia irritans TaxID=7368 RepID=UPI003F5061E8
MGRCFVCGFNHPIKYCTHFRWMYKDERRAVLERFNYCLSDRHRRKDCASTNRYNVCSGAHHTMIQRPLFDPCSESFIMADKIPQPPVCETVDSSKNDASNSSHANNETNAVCTNDVAPLALTTKSLLEKYISEPIARGPLADGTPILAPVALCRLRLGNRFIDMNFIIKKTVPKSHIKYSAVEHLNYRTKFKANIPYGQFEIVTRSGKVLKEWLIIVDDLKVYIPPPVKNSNVLRFLKDMGPIAHPQPHNYGPIKGVIGADICRYALYGDRTELRINPSLDTQNSAFGMLCFGSFSRCAPHLISGPGVC